MYVIFLNVNIINTIIIFLVKFAQKSTRDVVFALILRF